MRKDHWFYAPLHHPPSLSAWFCQTHIHTMLVFITDAAGNRSLDWNYCPACRKEKITAARARAQIPKHLI